MTAVRSTEVRVTYTAETPSEALAHAERELRSEGCEPTWASLSKQHPTNTWHATICGSKPIPETEATA